MKSHIGYFVLSVSGAITYILFSLVSQITPDINAQVTGENKTSNKIIMHIHSNLNVTVNGKSLIVPNGIGINSTLWNGHSLDKFGTERKTTIFGMITPAMSPLHTHDSSGTIHVESTEYRNYTLGQFLNIWGMPFEGSKVSLFIDGNSTENYSNYILKDMEKMILKIED
ncbi:MAG: hypothetical protein ACR2KF_07520 [Nitrososphaeraceae archaeon]